jgi:hypothetical protein
VLYGAWVRASRRCYSAFTLLMRSSPGFGSNPYDLFSAIKPRFHYASSRSAGLGLPYKINSLARSAKSTPSPMQASALTLRRHMVSVLFHSPHRGSFHLSLTVLVRYRSQTIFSLGSLVLPVSDGISPVPPYLRIITIKLFRFRLRDYYPLWSDFPDLFD